MAWLDRPTATVGRVLPWAGELARTTVGLAEAYVPGIRAISPTTREEVALAVSEIVGCRYTAWVHESWRAFLGPTQPDHHVELLVDYAREEAIEGTPLAPGSLSDEVSAAALRATRATVAITQLSGLVGNTADELVDRLRFRRPIQPITTVREVCTVAAALPIASAVMVAAAAMRTAAGIAPPLPVVRTSDDPDSADNIVLQIVADAIPHYLANAATRAVVLNLRSPLVVAVRGRSGSATARIARERISIEGGVADDATMVIEDGLDLLVEVAARSLLRELTALTGRRG